MAQDPSKALVARGDMDQTPCCGRQAGQQGITVERPLEMRLPGLGPIVRQPCHGQNSLEHGCTVTTALTKLASA